MFKLCCKCKIISYKFIKHFNSNIDFNLISFHYIQNVPTDSGDCANHPHAWGDLAQNFFLNKINRVITRIDSSFSKNCEV